MTTSLTAAVSVNQVFHYSRQKWPKIIILTLIYSFKRVTDKKFPTTIGEYKSCLRVMSLSSRSSSTHIQTAHYLTSCHSFAQPCIFTKRPSYEHVRGYHPKKSLVMTINAQGLMVLIKVLSSVWFKQWSVICIICSRLHRRNNNWRMSWQNVWRIY